MESRKEKGQYITPEKIVVMILDDIGYAEDEVLTKKIMEPSFGDGAFLSEIIKRIIKAKSIKRFILYDACICKDGGCKLST